MAEGNGTTPKPTPRKKTSPLPAEIKRSKVATRKKVTKANVEKYLEDMLLLFTPSMSFEFLKSLRQGVINGNKDDMKMAAHMMGYVPIPGGPNINVTTNIANSNQVSGGTYDKSIDSIIRKLDTQEQEQEQEVIDVTPR